MGVQKFKIVASQSTINWVGKKVTGAHNGTIDIKKGEVILKNGKLSAGNFIIDTTSIKVLNVTDPLANARFASHLASDDFFATQEFPEASLEITSVSGIHVQGNLSIKAIAHPIAFDAAVNVSGDLLTAAGLLVIDRTKYDMKFRSGNFFKDLGDSLIYNNFELNVSIVAKLKKNV